MKNLPPLALALVLINLPQVIYNIDMSGNTGRGLVVPSWDKGELEQQIRKIIIDSVADGKWDDEKSREWAKAIQKKVFDLVKKVCVLFLIFVLSFHIICIDTELVVMYMLNSIFPVLFNFYLSMCTGECITGGF